MFTYYQGKVTYQQLIEALVWQRRQRPTLGVIAQKWGWLSEAKVAHILGHRGHAIRFGKKAVELGFLKPHQVEVLLQHQRSLQRRIGQHFIDNGLGQVPELIYDLRSTLRDVQKLLHQLKEDPSQLIHRPPDDALEVKP